MAWQPTLYSSLGFGAAVLSLLVAGMAYRYREEPGGRQFVALMLALGGWSLAYAVQLGFTTPGEQLLWQRVALAIGGTIPTVWLLFTLRYTGKSGWLTPARQALLAVDPLVFGLLALTNPTHRLIWDAFAFVPAEGSGVVDLSLATGYYVHIAYGYLLVAGGLAVLMSVLARASTLYWRQTAILVVGALPPVLANVAYTLRVEWGPMPALDLTPFAFAVTGALFGLALFRFDLLERAPIARRQLIDEMGDGLVVLDADGTVVDVNPTARRILDPTPVRGERLAPPASADADAPADTVGTGAVANHAETDGHGTPLAAYRGRTVVATIDGHQRAYDVDVSTLTNHHGRRVGDALAFRDVTQRYMQQQRLDVAQRVLRHNLRNGMNVIRGWAAQIDSGAGGGGNSEGADRIVDATDELLDLSAKTRQMIALTEDDAHDPVRLDVREFLVDVLEEFRAAYPDVSVDCDVPPDVRVTLADEEPLAVAVRNLVENAIEHNAGERRVEVGVEQTAEGIRMEVADNGPGIPPIERDVLEEGAESALRHGSGVGLWLTYWSVTTLGGEITFTGREPRGSVVTLEVPDDDRGGSEGAPSVT